MTLAGFSKKSDKPGETADRAWTDEQREAIRLRGDNILVAAAAGSGKTAVLVERIIRRVTDERDPVDVDRLLVATFTNAAAGEMRQRIREALEKRLAREPNSAFLRRQLALVHQAKITTLHSFCLDVVRRHFQSIGLDPSFRIANETEAELMRQDLLGDLLEERYASSEEDSPFWRLAEWFGGERGDDALFRLIQDVYDYARSHPWPEHWLREMAGRFDPDPEAGDGGLAVWLQSLLKEARLELAGIAGLLGEAVRLAQLPGGPTPYLERLRSDFAMVESLRRNAEQGWDALYDAIRSASFGRLKPVRGDGFDKRIQEQTKALRKQASDRLQKMKDEWFARPTAQFREELAELAPVVAALVDIVIEFGERYQKQKAERGLVDFSDLEHYCLNILRHPDSTPERTIPSAAAEQYREQFAEVLLDEYQDTNAVQEAIVELISRPAPGNRFMVGDVKQSIYRFRLAEPGLFLAKYKSYVPSGERQGAERVSGRKIDLSRNFRSRRQIVDAVNYVFKQLMRETVAEIEYDEASELVCGADYPDDVSDLSVEFALIDRSSGTRETVDADVVEATESGPEDAAGGEEDETDVHNRSWAVDEEEAETARLEARLIAAKIRSLMGRDGDEPFRVYDREGGQFRPIVYRDIVVLLRATEQWAPVFAEELRLAGIPVYAESNTGYFAATEVETVLALLKVIDNPYQDIPLAAVLRSPMVGLSADGLARIRLTEKEKPFYDAVLSASTSEDDAVDDGLKNKLRSFLRHLEAWRAEARQGALSELIWDIYRETGFFDFVGGLPGGEQRQANLRALYDRARQFEATSQRGLFRFLRFIERMRDSGGDLGTARSLGEREDVVRIMSIHKSKGLEFPVVIVAGLGKRFNETDINRSFLLHRQLGFGPRYVDAELRVAYPTLPMMAIRRRLRMEMLAEEMRVLYVALTRPKEKLILIGTVKSAEKEAIKWGRQLDCESWALPDHDLAQARSYLDWLGPALIRHPQAGPLRETGGLPERTPAVTAHDSSRWRFAVVPAGNLLSETAAAVEVRLSDERTEALAQLQPVPNVSAEGAERVARRLSWKNPYAQAAALPSKTTVSELKRIAERNAALDGDANLVEVRAPFAATDPVTAIGRRPKFIEQRGMTAAERGTAMHAVMQHMPLSPDLDEKTVRFTLERMVEKRLLAPEQRAAVDEKTILAFFAHDIGRRLLRAERVFRELPFSLGLPAGDVYGEAADSARGETVLVQGIIDCLFEENGGFVLLDYKTDAVRGNRLPALIERYRPQLELYARAVETVWKKPVREKALYFFDGSHVVVW